MPFLACKTESPMLFQTRPGMPSNGIQRMIKRHQYWRKVTSDFSPDNRRRSSFNSIGYFMARQLERSAMRKLVRLEPASCDEAKEKVLYLIAAMMAGQTQLCAAETAKLGKSVEPFNRELATFLRQA